MSRIKAGWGCVRVEGTVSNTLKGEWNIKEGKENKDFKKGASWFKGLVP